MKHIKPLSDIEIETLWAAWRDGPTARVRQRAQAVYLSHWGYRRLVLAELFEVGADTITDWLNSWDRQGLRLYRWVTQRSTPALHGSGAGEILQLGRRS